MTLDERKALVALLVEVKHELAICHPETVKKRETQVRILEQILIGGDLFLPRWQMTHQLTGKR